MRKIGARLSYYQYHIKSLNIDLFAHFDIYQDHGPSPNQNPDMPASLRLTCPLSIPNFKENMRPDLELR